MVILYIVIYRKQMLIWIIDELNIYFRKPLTYVFPSIIEQNIILFFNSVLLIFFSPLHFRSFQCDYINPLKLEKQTWLYIFMDFTLFKNVSLYSIRAKKGNIMTKICQRTPKHRECSKLTISSHSLFFRIIN